MPSVDTILPNLTAPLVNTPKDIAVPVSNRNEIKTRETFDQAVTGTLFRLLLSQMRRSVPAGKLMHGGRSEEIFQAHLDQEITNRLAKGTGQALGDKLYAAFQLNLQASENVPGTMPNLERLP